MDRDNSSMASKSPGFYDPNIIPRVRVFLEENCNQHYVDVSAMASKLQQRYREYNRRKSSPFRKMVERAYAEVLKDYDLDEPSAGGDSDMEVLPVGPGNAPPAADPMNNMLANLYSNRPALVDGMKATDAPKSAPKSAGGKTMPGGGSMVDTGVAIDISSDEDDDDGSDSGESENSRESDADRVSQNGQQHNRPDKSAAGQPNHLQRMGSYNHNNNHHNAQPPVKKRKPNANEFVGNVGGPLPGHLASFRPGSAYGGQAPSGGGLARKNRFRYSAEASIYCFADVGGIDRILKDLCEMLLHVKQPHAYRHIGLPPPRGFLLHGPPGCGKTLLAQAIAGQLGICMIKVAATELIAGVSGESEERIRELFEQAAAVAPCVLFIDEIDAISSNRQNAQKDMERRIVAQLLTSLDALAVNCSDDAVIVIGATSRADVLDPALRRVGRFDQEISLGIPDRRAREQILRVICEDLRVQQPFDFDWVAAMTPGYVGADLQALAARAGATAVKRLLARYARISDRRPVNDGRLPLLVKPTVTGEPDKTGDDAKAAPVAMDTDVSAEKNDPADAPSKDEADKTDKAETDPTAAADEADKSTDKSPESDQPQPDKPAEAPSDDVATSADTATNAAARSDDIVDLCDDDGTADEPPSDVVSLRNVPLDEILVWLTGENLNISERKLAGLRITMDDFREALRFVQPSAKREGFITVPDVTWADIGALRDIREELQLAVLAPVRFPHKLDALGLKSPSGVLLCGPPGCGKTLLAKAVANEAGINFISVKGPELLNMYVGESERAVRQCFQRARNSAPCVIFFDEFDALCPTRSGSSENTSSSRVVNQLLTEMDGIEERRGVFLMAATNRPDIVDPAVLRPGRLDKILFVGLPGESERVEILDALTLEKPKLAEDVCYTELAQRTQNFTGADLAGLVRQASLQALKESIADVLAAPAQKLNGKPAADGRPVAPPAPAIVVDDERDDPIVVKRVHFMRALELIRPSVSEEDKRHYARLQKKYTVQPTGNGATANANTSLIDVDMDVTKAIA